jgi:hypothetical protein
MNVGEMVRKHLFTNVQIVDVKCSYVDISLVDTWEWLLRGNPDQPPLLIQLDVLLPFANSTKIDFFDQALGFLFLSKSFQCRQDKVETAISRIEGNELRLPDLPVLFYILVLIHPYADYIVNLWFPFTVFLHYKWTSLIEIVFINIITFDLHVAMFAVAYLLCAAIYVSLLLVYRCRKMSRKVKHE